MSATFIPTQITWRICPPVGAGGLGRNAFQYRDALMENICWTRTQGRYLHCCADRRISLCGRPDTTESSCLRGETGGPGRHLADTFHISLDNHRQTSGTSISTYNIRTITYYNIFGLSNLHGEKVVGLVTRTGPTEFFCWRVWLSEWETVTMSPCHSN